MFTNDPTTDFVLKIIVSFIVGALIGLERERTRIMLSEKKNVSIEHRVLPGIRSFGLLSLYGALLSYTAFNINDPSTRIILTVFMSSMIFITFIIYIYQRGIVAKRTGITTYIVISIALILGFLVGIDRVYEAIAASVFVTLVLAIKPSLQAFVRGITYKELLSGLELGLFVFILGPFFLFQKPRIFGIDISTFYILFIVILMLSYMSYIAVKIKGAEALKYIAFLGGMVNSEAAVSNIANVLSAQNISEDELEKSMTKYSYLIISAMMLRNLIVILILGYQFLDIYDLLRMALYVVIAMSIPLVLSLKTLIFEKEPMLRGVRVTIENPLTYSVAIRVVLAYSTIFIIGYVLSTLLPPEWLILLSALGGFVNAGATILTILTLGGLKMLSINFISLLVILSLTTSAINKLFFVKTVSKKEQLFKATLKAVNISLISSIIAIFLILFTNIS